MKLEAQQGLGVVASRGWGAVRPRHKEGKWVEGPSLFITAMFSSQNLLMYFGFLLR